MNSYQRRLQDIFDPIFKYLGYFIYASGILGVFTSEEPNAAAFWILWGLLFVSTSDKS